MIQFGMMNNPAFPLEQEINFASENGFDFLDLTMEPPGALLTPETAPAIREKLSELKLDVLGHTAYYLPIDSPFDLIRQATTDTVIRQLDAFKLAGAQKITIHMGFSYPHRFFQFHEKLQNWVKGIGPVYEHAENLGLQIMLENTQNIPDQYKILRNLFRQFPKLGFLLDVGHANLNVRGNASRDILKRFGTHLAHVHVSDNLGRYDDLHLPIGTGNICWPKVVDSLKNIGYSGTVTLEIFSADRRYLVKSREIFKEYWANKSGQEV